MLYVNYTTLKIIKPQHHPSLLGLAEGCPGNCPSGNTRSLVPSERKPHVESHRRICRTPSRSGMIFAEETPVEHSQKLTQYVYQ